MPDSKITALTSISTSTDPATDPLVIVDVSDTSMAATGTTKKVTLNQLLGASGTATLASATITGDLTVDTSTLKVDSTNNRVGIGTATPGTRFVVSGGRTGLFSGDAFSLALGQTTGQANYLYLGTDASGTLLVSESSGNSVMTLSQSGVCTWLDGAGGTRMTLNSTGLGVGTSSIVNAAAGRGNVTIGGSSSAILNLSIGAVDTGYVIHDGTSIYLVNRIAAGSLIFSTNSTERLRIDSSGNVGIGVTPTYKLDVSTGGVLNTTARLIGNDQSNVRLRFENTGASGRIWEFVGGLAGSNNRWFSLRDVTGSTTPWGVDDSMNVISNVTGTAPTLATNSQMVFNLTSNTNLRISVRGTDGVTRTANLTLA